MCTKDLFLFDEGLFFFYTKHFYFIIFYMLFFHKKEFLLLHLNYLLLLTNSELFIKIIFNFILKYESVY